ncbi:siderophore-interacting protein [Stigmatella sp. ncwal1]|uniref:Siderophore-interacting protein n=1 Tax=Stigmatella ashevillensis TaxID=2995309 RepID=A0ABT5D2X7_9BACT|nr:siderophore-interacting protein [Stigmatella ashevillena]MDC0707450.1 siderophore-interacting protein [Stigmatella ashevillena]
MMTQTERAPRRVPFAIKFRLLEVLRVAFVTPHMVRVTLGGKELEGFQTPAADDHVRLIFPAPGESKPLLPTLGPNGPVFPEGQPRPASRDYTPRRYDAAAGELDIDFVVHGSGPGTTWATHAKPGDFVGVGGPRSSMIVPQDFAWYLLAGDSTALPAIGRWLEELPAGAHAIVFIEVSDASEEQQFKTAARVELTWLHRNGAAPGTTNLLEKAIRELTFPPGDHFVWLAGEANTLRPIREHVYNERGTHKKWISATGYWKRNTADHHEPHD